MKLEDQVAPFELAQRMKALGFPQATCFKWQAIRHGSRSENWLDDSNSVHVWEIESESCAAPTVAEMGEWLPENLRIWHGKSIGDQRWIVYCEHGDILASYGATMAKAIAHFLIALAEAGTLDPNGLL